MVLIALFALMHAGTAIAAQDTSDTPAPRSNPDSSVTQTPRKPATPADGSTAANPASEEPAPSNQPQIIVNPPAPPPVEWGWRQQLTWGATIVLAVLGYVGIMLALRTLKSIDKHLESGGAVTKSGNGHRQCGARARPGDCEFREAMDRGDRGAVPHHGKQLQSNGV